MDRSNPRRGSAWGLADAVLLGLGLLAILGRRNLVIAQLQLAAFAILASIASVEISLRVLEIEPSFLLAEEYRLRQMDQSPMDRAT